MLPNDIYCAEFYSARYRNCCHEKWQSTILDTGWKCEAHPSRFALASQTGPEYVSDIPKFQMLEHHYFKRKNGNSTNKTGFYSNQWITNHIIYSNNKYQMLASILDSLKIFFIACCASVETKDRWKWPEENVHELCAFVEFLYCINSSCRLFVRLAMHCVHALRLKVDEQLRKSRVVVYNLSLPIYSIICLFYGRQQFVLDSFFFLSFLSNAHKKYFSSISFFRSCC